MLLCFHDLTILSFTNNCNLDIFSIYFAPLAHYWLLFVALAYISKSFGFLFNCCIIKHLIVIDEKCYFQKIKEDRERNEDLKKRNSPELGTFCEWKILFFFILILCCWRIENCCNFYVFAVTLKTNSFLTNPFLKKD